MSNPRVTVSQRRLLTARARECYEYCRSQAAYGLQSLSAEHIILVDKGGPTTLDNLALSCQGCNGHKYKKTEGYDPVT
jgi:5-methylcytosine-specific restriction endonuclease McrA